MPILDLLLAILGTLLCVLAISAVMIGAWEWIPGVNEPGYLHPDDRRKGEEEDA